MNRNDWLKARKRGIGGSDAAAILGLSPWASPMDVWLDKTGRREDAVADPDREFMLDLGLQLEPVIAGLYEKRTGRELMVPPWGCISRPDFPMLMGSPDRLVKEDCRGVELKSENLYSDKFGEPGTDQVPEHYLIQCVHYMALTGYKYWDIALLHGGARFSIYTIERDLDLESEMLNQLSAWWQRHVVGDTPPDVDGSDAWKVYLQKKHPANILPILDAEDEAAKLARKLHGCRGMIAHLENAEDELQNKLKVIIGDHEGIKGEFGKITWKKSKDGTDINWEECFRDMLAHHVHPDVQAQIGSEVVARHTAPKTGSRRFLFQASQEMKNGFSPTIAARDRFIEAATASYLPGHAGEIQGGDSQGTAEALNG